jgi:hypothetical protein
LAKHFDLEIAQYGVPRMDWFPWILKRLRTAGLLVLIGHLELSLFIKFQQAIERLFSKTIWEKYGVPLPQWTGLVKVVCKNEQALIEQFKGVDFVLALDSFRLSQSFFRKLSTPYFEISWGDATKFLGDSAAFWEYVTEERRTATVSLIERTAYFQRMSVLRRIPIDSITPHETLRSLKVKQAIGLSIQLPLILKEVFLRPDILRGAIEQKKKIKQCYAPTLFMYARWKCFGLDSLPKRVCRSKDILLKTPPVDL